MKLSIVLSIKSSIGCCTDDESFLFFFGGFAENFQGAPYVVSAQKSIIISYKKAMTYLITWSSIIIYQ